MTTWNAHYLPPNPLLWNGRKDIPDGSCFFHIMKFLNLFDKKSPPLTQPTFALLGFKCDEGIKRNTGRIGAAEGPDALRQALAKLPVHKENFAIYDTGNIFCNDADLESAQLALGEAVCFLLEKKMIPIIIGGGHELAWGHYQGIAHAFPTQNLGIINFDAHFDMRQLSKDNKGSSGTPFLQIARAHDIMKKRFDYNCIGLQHTGNIKQLIETAEHYQTKIIWADELHQGQNQSTVNFIDRAVDDNDIIYLTLCLDVFSAAFAPGVSAIQPLGLFPWNIIPLLRQAAASGKVVSYDIAELSPRYDIDQQTAKLAANLVYEITHHHNPQTKLW